MAQWQEDKIESALNEAFGPEPSIQQLWALTLFAKHVRMRCRNNTAFNNFMNRIYKHVKFQEVTKINEQTGERYEGLEITRPQ